MPRGGKRNGSGRPGGAKSALPAGTVSAIKALRHRVPDELSEDAKLVADRAFARIVAVMDEQCSPLGAFSVLAAAKAVREELCGPVKQKVEHSGPNGTPLVVSINLTRQSVVADTLQSIHLPAVSLPEDGTL